MRPFWLSMPHARTRITVVCTSLYSHYRYYALIARIIPSRDTSPASPRTDLTRACTVSTQANIRAGCTCSQARLRLLPGPTVPVLNCLYIIGAYLSMPAMRLCQCALTSGLVRSPADTSGLAPQAIPFSQYLHLHAGAGVRCEGLRGRVKVKCKKGSPRSAR